MPVDLVFLLDASGSIGWFDFQVTKNFVKTTTSDFQIGPKNTQVDVVQYEDWPREEFPLNRFATLDELLPVIDNVPYLGGGTQTAANSVVLDVGMAVNEFTDEVNETFRVVVANRLTVYCQRHVLEFESCRRAASRAKRSVHESWTFNENDVVTLEGFPQPFISPNRTTLAFFVRHPDPTGNYTIVPGHLLLLMMQHNQLKVEEALGWKVVHGIYPYIG
ncbi:COL21A1 [Branchiostoma lanceolatum]|uniref:COL21A1 protein n=1 Tax=Branchiostoma lanceolatum TaxID=7740 RepID=A0A8J9ZXB6_BRALA|nr:COL21A1 [Branchiostoma lanceolatum]